ncbi:MAG: patatin-like phospholipase family protein [Oligoflexus sp.]
MSRTINLLALSGGGVRGLLSAHLIKSLQDEAPFLDKVSLFSGTSTGSLIAAGLATKKLSPDDLIELFRTKSELIFKYHWLDKIKSIGGIYKAKYSHDGIKGILQDVFSNMLLGDISTPILIPAFDLGSKQRSYRAKFFSNFPITGDPEIKLVDALLASISAPTYFPAWKIHMARYQEYRDYVDGGIAVNHPSISAIAAAMDRNGLNAQLEEISCLAIGTGISNKNAIGWRERGMLGWATDVIDLALEQYSTVNYQADNLLKGRYESRFRLINPGLPRELKLDDIETIPVLEDVARQSAGLVHSAAEWLLRNWGRQSISRTPININSYHREIPESL